MNECENLLKELLQQLEAIKDTHPEQFWSILGELCELHGIKL